MAKKFNLLWLLFKLSFPFTIAATLLVVIYGYLQSWPVAEPILISYSGQSHIMVGASYRETSKKKIVSRSYILIPSAKVITIQQLNQENPVVSESKSGFYIFVFSIFASFFGAWWFWFRKKQ